MDNLEKKSVVNDASGIVGGFLYQFYVALNYCFELKKSEKLYIEKFGDVSIKGITQIEVKNYSNPLTDAHDNFWKTLHNWCDESFKPKDYKYLILLTTQQIGMYSQLKDWNQKNKEEKIKIVVSIAEEYCEKNKSPNSSSLISKVNQMKSVISIENRDRLEIILEKFRIIDCAPGFEEFFENVKNQYARHIPEANKDSYLNALLGFILNPKIVSNNWEITYESFTDEVQNQTGLYHEKTIIFPKIRKRPSQEQIDEQKEALFVKKLDDISYYEVKNEAITDFLYTNNLLLNELHRYQLNPDIMLNYATDLLSVFESKKRRYIRNLSSSMEEKSIIKESQNFYDDVTGEKAQSFVNFNDTPIKFRNGFYHIMAEDDEKTVVWRLKKGSEDDKTI